MVLTFARRIQRIKDTFPEISSRFYQSQQDWHPLFRHNSLARISTARLFLQELDELERNGIQFGESDLIRENITPVENGLDHVREYLDDSARPPVKTYHEPIPYRELAGWLKDELHTYLDTNHPLRFNILEPTNDEIVHVDRRAFMECAAELVRNATNATRKSERPCHPVLLRLSLSRPVNGKTQLALLVVDRGEGFQGTRPQRENGANQIHGGDGVRNIIVAAHNGAMIYRNRRIGGSIIGFQIPLEKRGKDRR